MLINSPNISGSLTVTGNAVITGSLTVLGGINATITGSATTASYVEYSNVANKPTLVSGSSQVTYSGLTGVPSGIVSGSSQITYSGISGIPSGIVSGSAQVTALGFATTGSNTFQANQTITGSLFITQNLVVAGSSSIQYISSSVLDIADNIITVNAFNPAIRFGGLAVIDSGSSPQVSGSLLFDSIKDQWIFVHQNQAVVTSSVLLMGPEVYDNIGNETYLSANRLPKGSGVEHLRDSNISDTGTVVSVNSNTQVTGSLTLTSTLNGTSATFSGDINTTAGFFNFPNNYGVQGRNAANTAYRAVVKLNTSNQIEIGRDTDISAIILGTASSNNALTISSTGIATFIGTTVAANGSVNIESLDPAIRFRVTSGTANSRIYEWRAVAAGGVNDIMQLRLWNDAQSSASTLFTVSPTGAGIFSSHITGTCTTSFNGDGFRAIASATGGAGSQPGIGYWTAAGSKRFINQLDVSTDTWAVTGTTGTNYLLIAQSGAATFSSSVTIQGGNSLFVNNASNARSGYLKTSDNGTELSSFAGAGEPLILIAPDTTANIRFYTAGSTVANERMRITSGGNVGIGTTSPYTKLDVRGPIAMGDGATYPLNARMVKQGTTSVTFTATVGTIGAWRPGHAMIKVSGGQNGLQEYWAAWFYIRIIAYFASSAICTVVDSGGDTSSVSFSSTSNTSSPQTVTFTLTDGGGTTNTMIADIDLTYNEGIVSLS
jgi:hypothetical protein